MVCLKIFLILVNGLFLTVGMAILGLGIYLCTSAELGKYSEVLAAMETLRSVRLILIGCGCAIAVIGLCGCAGACREIMCLLIVYVILLALILVANIAAIALSFVYTNEVKSYAVEQMKDSLKRFYGNETDPAGRAFTQAVDSVQTEESCCGWTGLGSANFFPSTPWYRRANANATAPGQAPLTFPVSRCAVTEGAKLDRCTRATDEADARDFGYLHADDCWDRIMSFSGRFVHATLGTVAAAVLLQIVCIACAVALLRLVGRGSSGGGGRRGGVHV